MNENNTMTHKCIYCLKEKPESEFNCEHVISKFMGKYENSWTLTEFQVCQECNTCFCNEMENVLSTDSLEGLMKTVNHNKKSESVRAIGKTRLDNIVVDGIFKGIPLFAYSAANEENNLKVAPAPVIGIINEDLISYDYHSIDSIPEFDDSIGERLSKSKTPVIAFGYPGDIVLKGLKEKGYSFSRFENIDDISELADETQAEVRIDFKVDNPCFRFAAKNIFNFLCCRYGKNYVLAPKFDRIRRFIRYNEAISQYIAFHNADEFKNVLKKNKRSHIVGTAVFVMDAKAYLCGFISWYNVICYIFGLYSIFAENCNDLPEARVAVFDNAGGKIIEKIILRFLIGQKMKKIRNSFLKNWL